MRVLPEVVEHMLADFRFYRVIVRLMLGIKSWIVGNKIINSILPIVV